MKKLLVTCALPYANGPIHIGHLVEHIQADIWIRYLKLRGRDVLFLCADDTHGTPIMIRASKEGVTPEQLIDRVWHEHVRDFVGFDVEYDNYHSTHAPENRQLSFEMYEALKQGGHIEVRDVEQAYCPQDKIFLPDRYIKGTCPSCGAEDQYGDACEVCSKTYDSRELRDPYCGQCGTTPEWRTSEHLFFRLGHFTDQLKAWVEGGHVQEQMANKLKEWFETGLQDWDISRDAPYFGFEIPDYPGKYFYVWLDAPVGYMASTLNWCEKNDADFDDYWRPGSDTEIYHFIGKDIVYFHALFWPATLMGAGFRTPEALHVHGFLTVNGEKMSKTRGTFINADTYLEHLDPQYLRYYYAAKLNSRVEDIDLSFEDFRRRVDSDLVNKIANIPSRALAILHKRCGGRLGVLDAEGRELVESLRGRCEKIGDLYESREYSLAVRGLCDMASDINTYFQHQEPWKVAKEDPQQAAVICTAALNGFKILATLILPILPRFGEKFASMMDLPELSWDGLDEFLENRPVNVYDRLIDRVDPSKIEALTQASRESLGEAEQAVEPPELTLAPLVDVEIRGMAVAAAERLEGDAAAYLRLRLEDSGRQRSVLARLGEDFDESELAEARVTAVTNLAARKIQGHLSEGMILAAKVDGVPHPIQLVSPEPSASDDSV